MLKDLEDKLTKTIHSVKQHFSSLRTGRAHSDLLSPIMVEYYGAFVPLVQVATITTPESNSFLLNVFDKGAIKAVEKAIQSSDLSLNPQIDGGSIRIRLPELTEARRKELVKMVWKYAEEGKIAVRNLRRDVFDDIKRQEKNKSISEDDSKRFQESAQRLVDQYIGRIDQLGKEKEAEILKV